jgi:hypothetical protein
LESLNQFFLSIERENKEAMAYQKIGLNFMIKMACEGVFEKKLYY